MNELIVKEAEELKGLEASKATQIKAIFAPMIKMLEEFEEKYKEVVESGVSDENCKRAKRLRLDISKIRVSADKARKEQKEEYLRAGNAIQGVYNILKFAVVDKEEKLKEIETHFERLELARIATIKQERQSELIKYEVDGAFIDLGNMEESIWENYLAGVKANYEAIKEAERKAEEDRLKAEQKEIAEKKRVRAENERLRAEAEKREEENRKALAKVEAEKEKIRAEAIEKERLRAEAEKQKAEAEKAEAEKRANAPDAERMKLIIAYLAQEKLALKNEDSKTAISEASVIIETHVEKLST